MEIFLDSVDLNEIKELREFIDGVTTNPSLIAKYGYKYKYEDLISEMCSIIEDGPISVEVVMDNYEDMIKESLRLARISSNVVIKLPITYDGLIACKKLWMEHKIHVNMTLCFSPGQALLAAKVGACFVSPFVGRLDDTSYDGLSLIKDICTIYSNYNFSTKVLVASVRSPIHVLRAARLGANSITISGKIFRQLFRNPLSEYGILAFKQDWNLK